MSELRQLRALTWARAATGLVFFLNGFGHGSWAPRLAEIQARHGISDGLLGIALFALALGAILAMSATATLAGRIGSRTATRGAVVIYGLMLPSTVLVDGPLLFGAFLLFGMAVGALDVAMNSQAVTVEHGYGRSIMSGLHGMFSLGGMAGALAAGALADAGLDVLAHLAGTGVILAAAGALACGAMLRAEHDPKSDGPRLAAPGRALLALGAIAFCGLLAEGSVGDWSAIYLSSVLGAGTSTAAAAFAVFSITMAIGRFSGDHLVTRLGGVALVRAGGLLAALGLALGLVLATPLAAIIGYGLVGAGLACIFPIVLSASARTPGIDPAMALAGVCTLGYFGLLAGPAMIGLLAELAGLPMALALVAVLCALIALLAGAIGRSASRPGVPPPTR